MNIKISERKKFLAERKKNNNRVTVGFSGVADLRSFIAIEYLSGMMKAAEDYDVNFINMGAAVKYSLFEDINFINNYLKNFKFMKAPFVDGMITWASSFAEFMTEEKAVEVFSSLKPLPIVDIGHSELKGAVHLKINSIRAVSDVMDHLTHIHNYSRFAFIGSDASKPHTGRLNAYREYLREHNLTELPDSAFMAKSMSINHIAEQVDLLCSRYSLKNKESLDAIICSTDIIASEVIEQLEKRGISVPKDVAITGFNNWYEGITARSPLTTVDLSYFKRGYAAVEHLIDRIISPSSRTEVVMYPASLIVRQSCGCFELGVKQSGITTDDQNEVDSLIKSGSVEEIKRYLTDKSQSIFIHENRNSIKEFIDCFFDDLYDLSSKNKMLLWLQKRIQDGRRYNYFDGGEFQQNITDFRFLIMPFLKDEDGSAVIRIENIYHEMRALISVFQRYEIMAARENPYRIGNISEQALQFIEADSIENLFEVLKTQLGKFEVPGAVIALSDSMTYSFPSPTVRFVYPETNRTFVESIVGKKIEDAKDFPKAVFPQDNHVSAILEMLSYNDHNFGYAFFMMKTPNIVIYDVLRLLISNALYRIYSKKEKPAVKVSAAQIDDIITNGEEKENRRSLSRRLSVEKLSAYFISHIADKTNIDQIAKDFMVSKSFLSKKTKELTGLSVQSLHEKIKIEQAKSMLMSGFYELNEISSKLGFANQNYFSNVFKKNTGLSPLNWLKKNR